MRSAHCYICIITITCVIYSRISGSTIINLATAAPFQPSHCISCMALIKLCKMEHRTWKTNTNNTTVVVVQKKNSSGGQEVVNGQVVVIPFFLTPWSKIHLSTTFCTNALSFRNHDHNFTVSSASSMCV